AFANGRFPPIFVPYRTYRERVTDSAGVLLWDIDGIPNPAPPSSGGGSGIIVTQDMVLQTGDVMWQLRGGTRPGWARLNGRTIGNASSGATERANDDTEDLYAFLWNNLDNSVAPVIGGRGATASADFAANKAITLPSMQGRAPLGLDDMGGAAANVLQVAKTINTTNGSNTATVSSATGLGVGMYVISANIPTGATITNISGTTLTLSANATATASNTAARFSYISNAQQPGVGGGSALKTLSVAQMPPHSHTGSTSTAGSHTHGYTRPSTPLGGTGAAGGGTYVPGVSDASTASAGDHSHTLTINNTGGGQPFDGLPPVRLGTWYIKL
ncbi:MAG TPA: hypothetical protein VIK69_07210, partial [Methylophilaceae bacterium]